MDEKFDIGFWVVCFVASVYWILFVAKKRTANAELLPEDRSVVPPAAESRFMSWNTGVLLFPLFWCIAYKRYTTIIFCFIPGWSLLLAATAPRAAWLVPNRIQTAREFELTHLKWALAGAWGVALMGLCVIVSTLGSHISFH
jgi:hypothetical protein